MSETIGYADVCRMLLGAVEQIRTHHALLSQLDSAVGDGDHGVTILRTMEAVAKTISKDTSRDLKQMLAAVGWAVMSCDGGSTGPLLGSLFTGLSAGTGGRTELTGPEVATMFEGGITRMQKTSRAQVGDKTMMDAFLPALAALKATDPALGIRNALRQAAAAAAAGAEATKPMRAKFGRARNLGDRAIGHADPGAVSVSLIFKGFSDAL